MRKRLHLHISLVGGQPTPVYQGIVHVQPDQIVLVCSKQSKKVASDIRKQLPSYSDSNLLIFEMSDTDLEQMYATVDRIEQLLPKGISISMNISGGMKLWSVIFNNVFRRKRRGCHTFCIGQNGTFFDLKERTSKGKVEFDMETQFKILGHALDEYTLLSDYTSEDNDVFNRVKNLGLSYRYHLPFAKLTETFATQYKADFGNTSFVYDYVVDVRGNSLVWEASSCTFTCNIGGNIMQFHSPHVLNIVLNTGWFELYVARIISKKYGEDKVRLNCVFKNVKNLPKNEIDIIVNTGSKLIFVECKTQIFNTTDIDKFRSAVRNYGGLGSKPLFVTNWKMKPEGLEKCRDHRIDTFYLDNPSMPRLKDKEEGMSNILDTLDRTWNF